MALPLADDSMHAACPLNKFSICQS